MTNLLLRFIFPPLLMVSVGLHAQKKFPPNIFADSLHYPFLYGVASADPDTNSVLLWTKVVYAFNETEVKWQIAEDSSFTSVSDSGSVIPTRATDDCITLTAHRLQSGKKYFYRFTDLNGRHSVIGKAQTLPAQNVSSVRFGVVSCSSIWSGYFNAYKKIAERGDIDFVIHLGDYVYDFVDRNEKVRVPEPFPNEPANLKEWRERHTYYLLDPDLRAARQSHTWIAEWDNHDIDKETEAKLAESIRAFYEYVPVRVDKPLHPERIYRSFNFGNLVQLNIIDMFLLRGKEEYAAGMKSVLGNEQQQWLFNQLSSSGSKWHLIGNQEMMSDWLSEGAPKIVKLPGNGRVFDDGNWNGFPDDRERLFNFIHEKKIKNTVVMTGDAHMGFCMDLSSNPKNDSVYNHKTGEGGLGVEFVTPSVSRGNFNENGIPPAFAAIARNISMKINPHHVYSQFTKHGYAILDVSEKKCVLEFWFTKILKSTDKQSFGRGYTCLDGANHWERKFNKNIKLSSRYNFGIQ